MEQYLIEKIAQDLRVSLKQVEATLNLLTEGNTVPFIARYRKEATGALDEEQILKINKEYDYQLKLAQRKEAVKNLIEQQGKLTEEIIKQIDECTKLSQVEDIYRPYMQKKKTRAAVAIKNGLEPLAEFLLSRPKEGDVEVEAQKYLNDNVKKIEDALQGARDIIAERVSDDAKQRWDFKQYIEETATLVCNKKKDALDEQQVYQMYYEYQELVKNLKDHRIMAVDRAEKENVISAKLSFDEDYLIEKATSKLVVKEDGGIGVEHLELAAEDGCKRLLFPSLEREIRSDLSNKAQEGSIKIFALNLEKLLLQAPLKGRIVMGFDPAFRTGCKLAILDATGKLLHIDKIYPHEPKNDVVGAKEKLLKLIKEYGVQIIAIGNGTASRESERLVADLIKENNLDIAYALISEAGASVYSASDNARAEFPDLQVEERSAVSIGRRLLDPLAELIKIDPKSIGVGQYQHDLPAKELDENLEEVLMKCVNRTGCDVNTASVELLSHISGLNSASAKEIVNYRNQNGKFTNRQQLKKVKRIGDKAFEQSAGFLRIVDGDEPLDATAIHPESYENAKAIMKLCEVEIGDSKAEFDKDKLATLDLDSYTLKDIEEAIRQPLRDYREQFETALLKSEILELSDLHEGDELSGTVRNVVDFGAFVDIGLHDDGLIHISKMSKSRINHPGEVVNVGDIVKVYVYAIDLERSRIQLSLLSPKELSDRDASVKYRKNKNNKREVTMEDALARLQERFGSKHKH